MTQEREAVARIEATLDRAYGAMAQAFGRIHQLPRATDTGIADRLQQARAQIERCKAEDIALLQSGGEGWRDISTLPDDDTMVLGGCPDGRIMVWRGSILARNLRGPTPEHLQFPATGWMPLPPAPNREGV